MKVRYSYLPQQFKDTPDLWKDLKNFVKTGDFTLGKPLVKFEKQGNKDNMDRTLQYSKTGKDLKKIQAKNKSLQKNRKSGRDGITSME